MVNLQGAVDLHIHSHPCLIPRLLDDRQVAQQAAEVGMRAVMLKCHHESTVSRAYLLDSEFPELRVLGGIVLNNYVGGINPAAAEAALRMGGKEVWMPTVDAAYHARVYGGTGRYDVQETGTTGADLGSGLAILQDGRLTEATIAVLDVIAEHDAILGTCHLSPEEIEALLKEARKRGVRKVLLTHPYFKVPGVTLDFIEDMVKLGAKAEFGYCTISPMWNYSRPEIIARSIIALGAENCVLISDAGQRHNPRPVEALRVFAQCLAELGIGDKDVETMMVDNPRQLLSLE